MLTDEQRKRLAAGIRAAFALPFIDDIEDFIWEAIFAYAKGIPVVDPLSNIRSKRLFDVVDEQNRVGWSVKAIQRNFYIPCAFEVVIQRADIIKKAQLLGFDQLTIDAPPHQLGAALMKHWNEMKVDKDSSFQGVEDKRIAILLKSRDRRRYAYLEEPLIRYTESDLIWQWTGSARNGLQARRALDGRTIFRWYPNQKQLFERFVLTEQAYTFNIEPQRLVAADAVALLLAKLEDTP